MYESFGAVVTGSRVSFQLFLPENTVDPTQYVRGGSPRIRIIRVAGDFQALLGGESWDPLTAPAMSRQPHPSGWLYRYDLPLDLPEGFYEYKYFVTFEDDSRRWCSDPCSKYGGSGEHENAGFAIGGNRVDVRPVQRPKPLQDLTLYELMIDDFTAELRGDGAPIDAVRQRVDYFERLGVNAVEMMPWTAWPGGDFSWGYDPVQFFAVEYRYINDPAEPADKLYRLQRLINALHDRGIHVVMDGVFNHVRAGITPNQGFPYRWLYLNPADSPYIGDFEGGGFFEELDYQNGCVREFVRDVCLYWMNAFQVDGIRFDYTRGYYRRTDLHVGIARLVADIRDALSPERRAVAPFILEHLPDNRFEAIDDTNRICATSCWFDPLMFAAFAWVREGKLHGDALRVLDAGRDFAPGKLPVTYVENHDHSSLVHEAGGRDRWYKAQPAAIVLMTCPGAPMIHNGQEFAEDYWLPESGPGRVEPRPLRWATRGPGSLDPAGERLFELYCKLIAIRNEHPALRAANFFPRYGNHPDGYGVFAERGLAIYHRWGEREDGAPERFLVVVSFSDFDQMADIPFPANGEWRDLLNGETATVTDYKLRWVWVGS
ncbi:MAG: 1,4-alpha-glucan branching enzyme, partial [Acidobacteria bacterium]|nr:1,4-alpha-glucan branching enzyme [Acidobacteriota bacterium]